MSLPSNLGACQEHSQDLLRKYTTLSTITDYLNNGGEAYKLRKKEKQQ